MPGFTAYVIGHPHVALRRNGSTAYEALQALFTGLLEYAHNDAKGCLDFWTIDECERDYTLLGRVEGFCGAFVFECVPI